MKNWAAKIWHEEMHQNCDNCRFSVREACLRYPPVIQPSRSDFNQGEVARYHKWCGEWQPDFMEDKMEPTKI